ncbi:MAG: vancomycin resistance protein, partial [Thermus caldifontis]
MLRRIGWISLLGLALAQTGSESPPIAAILVVEENVIEEGQLRTYVGSQTHPIASEKELRALLKKLAREARPPRFIFQDGRWRGVEKKGIAFDEAEVLAAYREALSRGRKSFRL